MLACEVQMGTPALASSALPLPSPVSELEMLQRLFIEYSGERDGIKRPPSCFVEFAVIHPTFALSTHAETLHDLSAEVNRAKLNGLLVQMQARGIYG